MSTHKMIDIICIVSIILAVALTILLMGGRVFGMIPVMNQETNSGMFTANDLDADWDTSSATKITLSDMGSVISGNGVYVNDGDIYIAYAGHYVLTGELTNGSVIIDADKSDKIWLLLDGVKIHCDDDAAIRVEQADKVFLTLADDTENTISSGMQYDAETVESGVDGAIYSRDDLTINGTGSLVVSTEYYHGIVCNDDFAITGGNISISAVQDGIHANDSVRIRDSVISISAGDDGITVSNDDETAFLYVESGSISIQDCYEGLEAVDITIAGGTIDILPTDDGINAAGSGENSVIRITGGNITIVNPSGRDADGLDSNGSIYIEGGKIFISVSDNGGNCAIDYGSENGGECVVSGGTVIACGGSAMAEGFDSDSPQGFLLYNGAAESGAIIELIDSDGRELLSEEIPCSFSLAVLSTPELKVGDVCTIMVDDVQEEITIDNSSNSGFNSRGFFGGGMRDGRNHGGMSEGQGNRNNQSVDDQEDRDYQNNPPQDFERPERSEDVLPVDNMFEPPDDSAFPGNEPPDGTEPPNNMGPPDDMGFSGDIKSPDRGSMPGGGKQTEREQMRFGEDSLSANDVSDNRLALLGISVLALLSGLIVAIKIEH